MGNTSLVVILCRLLERRRQRGRSRQQFRYFTRTGGTRYATGSRLCRRPRRKPDRDDRHTRKSIPASRIRHSISATTSTRNSVRSMVSTPLKTEKFSTSIIDNCHCQRGEYNMVYWGTPIYNEPEYSNPAIVTPSVSIGSDMAALYLQLRGQQRQHLCAGL